jgi:hypothetical protein
MNIKRTSFPAVTALALASLAAAMTSCASSSAPAAKSLTAVPGAAAPLGAGTVSSFVTTDAAGKPVEMGLTLSDAALTGLGDDMSMVVLSLPHVANLPFANAVINWNPHGHPPAHIYDVPHFDMHFYQIDETTRLAISPSLPEAATRPAAALIPAGYVPDPSGVVPQMGQHYVLTSAPEFHGQPFTATPIYGFWNGHAAFVEGMVTTAYLSSRQPMTQSLNVPAAVDTPGYYPTAWHIAHNPAGHTITVAFDGFVKR